MQPLFLVFFGMLAYPNFFFRDTYREMGLIGFRCFSFLCLLPLLFAWLYNSTAGSLLLVILFHIFFNWLSVSEAGGQYVAILMTMPVILWSIYVVRNMARKTRRRLKSRSIKLHLLLRDRDQLAADFLIVWSPFIAPKNSPVETRLP